MRRRTEASPKIALMSSRPMPRTSSKFCSKAGQRPSTVLGASWRSSTTSSATKPCPREISSKPNSLLPKPESPVISTPMPSTSIITPWRSPDAHSSLVKYTRSPSITRAAFSGVVSSGVWWARQRARKLSGTSSPSAIITAGVPPLNSSSVKWSRWAGRKRW